MSTTLIRRWKLVAPSFPKRTYNLSPFLQNTIPSGDFKGPLRPVGIFVWTKSSSFNFRADNSTTCSRRRRRLDLVSPLLGVDRLVGEIGVPTNRRSYED